MLLVCITLQITIVMRNVEGQGEIAPLKIGIWPSKMALFWHSSPTFQCWIFSAVGAFWCECMGALVLCGRDIRAECLRTTPLTSACLLSMPTVWRLVKLIARRDDTQTGYHTGDDVPGARRCIGNRDRGLCASQFGRG